jgi:hypothetical protein
MVHALVKQIGIPGYIMSQQVGFDLSKSDLFKKSPDVDLDECRLQYWGTGIRTSYPWA